MNKYDFFKQTHLMNKEDIVADVDKTLEAILKNAEKDPRHSYAYYATLKSLLEEFKKSLDDIVFIRNLDDGWCYDWGVSYSGADLQLVHYNLYEGYAEDSSLLEFDQIFTLFTVPTKLLTVDEYALLHGVEVVTVRQWIRRGKIRTAKKYGNEWRIPSLTDTPNRGYSSAFYEWKDTLAGLPDDLEYLNDYGAAFFMQDDEDKKQFYVRLYDKNAKNGVVEAAKVLECTTTERERIELAIISQPSVEYKPNFTDHICVDLVNIYSNGGDGE